MACSGHVASAACASAHYLDFSVESKIVQAHRLDFLSPYVFTYIDIRRLQESMFE